MKHQYLGNFQDHLTLLYGPPKIGKTQLTIRFPGVYLLPTEPGYKWANVRKSFIPNWATFIEFIKHMEKNRKLVKTVKMWGVDTVDNLSKFCMQYVCGRENIAHPSDEEWGKGWEAFRDEFTHWIMRLTSLGPGTLFISHEQERDVISRSITITKRMPAMPKTCYTVINNLVDVILNMGTVTETKLIKGKKKRVDVRCLFTKPAEHFDAGDRTGKLPDEIRFKTEQEAVDEILACFD